MTTTSNELIEHIQNSMVGLLAPIVEAIPSAPSSINHDQLEKNCQQFTIQLVNLFGQYHQASQQQQFTEADSQNHKKRRRTNSFDAKPHPDHHRARSEPNPASSHPTSIHRSHSLNPTSNPAKPSPNEKPPIPITSDSTSHQPSNQEPTPQPRGHLEGDVEDPISEELRMLIQSEIEAGIDNLALQIHDSLSDAKRELILLNHEFWKTQTGEETSDPSTQHPPTSSPLISPPTKIEAASIGEKLKFQFENHMIHCYKRYLEQFVFAIGFTGLGSEPLDFAQVHQQPLQQTPSEANLDNKTPDLDPKPEQSLSTSPTKDELEKNSLVIKQLVEEKFRSNSEEIGRMVEEKVKSNSQQNEQMLQEQLTSNRTKIGLDFEEKITAINQTIEQYLGEKLRPIGEQTERMVEEKLISNSQKSEREIEEKLESLRKESERTIEEKLSSTSQKIEDHIEERLSPITQATERMVQEKLQSYQEALEKQAVEYRKGIRSDIIQCREENSKDLDDLIGQIQRLFVTEKDKLSLLQKQTDGFQDRIAQLESLLEKETDPVLRRKAVLISLGLLESNHVNQKSNLSIFLTKLNDHLRVNLGQIDIQDPTWNPRLALGTPNGHHEPGENRAEPGADPSEARRGVNTPSTPRMPQASATAVENLFFEKLLIQLLRRINETVRLQEGQPNGFNPEAPPDHDNQGHRVEDQNYQQPDHHPDQAHQNHNHQGEHHPDTHGFPQDNILAHQPHSSDRPPLQEIHHILDEFFELNFKKFVWPKFSNLIFHLEQYLASQQV
ncbi:hypothetical protein PtA15_1A1011 [Puccinia triticina]|uniref:MIF4G domain-containing protein n=1 Tax=Puccinia triticina TaxID=208348 RepID=A0ABY7CAG2_9BASI|nr:uncharacterized protein PtA15_1A1011 [Puccinia triticina]WAQ81669.1 hypothetical protein PtA15_1A1011 [Puccinia triticina]